MPQLIEGYQFPSMEAETVKHGRISLPQVIPADKFSLVLAYRAHW